MAFTTSYRRRDALSLLLSELWCLIFRLFPLLGLQSSNHIKGFPKRPSSDRLGRGTLLHISRPTSALLFIGILRCANHLVLFSIKPHMDYVGSSLMTCRSAWRQPLNYLRFNLRHNHKGDQRNQTTHLTKANGRKPYLVLFRALQLALWDFHPNRAMRCRLGHLHLPSCGFLPFLSRQTLLCLHVLRTCPWTGWCWGVDSNHTRIVPACFLDKALSTSRAPPAHIHPVFFFQSRSHRSLPVEVCEIWKLALLIWR